MCRARTRISKTRRSRDDLRSRARGCAAVSAQHSSVRLSRPLLLLDIPIQSVREADLIEALVQHAPQTLATVPRGDTRSIAMLENALGVPPTACDEDSPQIRAASDSQISADHRSQRES